MKFDKELWGLRFELVGLFLVLLTAVWQVTFTDWFEDTAQDWVRYIQEDVNYATLRALSNISSQVAESDPEKQKERAQTFTTLRQKHEVR